MANHARPSPPIPHAPSLVGREREQAALHAALDAARAGRGSLVLVGGEAGIGKTALAEWLMAEAEGRGAMVLVGRCYDLSETPPYGPWIEGLAGIPRGDCPLPPPDLAGGGEATSQAALFAQVRDFFAALATRRPLVLLLDDLHWADPASLDLLRVLSRALTSLSALLLVTYRSDELTRHHPLYQLLPALERESRAMRLDLRPLGEAALHALVGRYALAADDAARLVAWLHSRGEGNAFFTAQLLRALEEEGALQRVEHGWALGDLGAVGLPAPLRQVLDARLDRLGDGARRLLVVAAILGQEVSLALWAAVAETDEDGLLDTIERAAEARLLEALPAGDAVRFAHALVREALYAGILPMRRRRLHLRAGEVLALAPRPDPDAVAYQLGQAGDARAADWLVRAGERAQRAHAELMAADAYEAAAALLARADAPPVRRGWLLYRLALLRRATHPGRARAHLDEAARIGADADDLALLAAVAFARGFDRANNETHEQALAALGASVAALEALAPEDMARLNEQDGLPAAADCPTWRGALVFHLSLVGHYAEALAMGERFLATTAAPPSGGTLRGWHYGGAYLGLGVASAMLGQPDRAERAFTEARTLFQLVGSRGNMIQAAHLHLTLALLPYGADRVGARRELVNAGERVRQHLREQVGLDLVWVRMSSLLLEGDWAAARAMAEQAHHHEHGNIRRIASVLLGPLLRAQGEPGAAWAHVHQHLPAGPDAPPGAGRCDQLLVLQRLAAALALDDGDLPAARAWLAAHDRWLGWSGVVLGRAEGALGWAAYHQAAGDPAQAHAHAEQALAHASAPRQPLALLAAHRVLGELDTETGTAAAAQAHLDASLALAEACEAPYERALTLLARADLHAATGERDAARATLAEAQALLVPLGARPALARAAALAARLDPVAPAPPPRPAAHPAGLTAREAEVLRLVALGMTNSQIAEQLSLSTRTVEQHLRAVYGKLGVENRTTAARLAIERGLTREEP